MILTLFHFSKNNHDTVMLILSNLLSFEENIDALLQPSFDSVLSKDNSNELSSDDMSNERASSKFAYNRYAQQRILKD